MKKGRLGKGLDALFSSEETLERSPSELQVGTEEQPAAAPAETEQHNGQEVRMLDIYSVEPDRAQPRKSFDAEKLQELADSIKQYGVLQPILVQKEKDYYRIIAGERRWRAARLAGLTQIPAVVREFEPLDAMAVSLIENLQRQELNPMEECAAYQQLMDQYQLTQEEIADRIGRSRSSIANSLRLRNLPEPVQQSLAEGLISFGHAKVLLGLDDSALQTRLAARVIGDSLSVRDLEKLVAQQKKAPARRSAPPEKALPLQLAEEKLTELLGTRVTVNSGARKGKIEIESYSADDLDRILSILER